VTGGVHGSIALPRGALDDPGPIGAAADLRYGAPLVVRSGRRQYLGVDPHDHDGHQHGAPAEHEAAFDEEVSSVLRHGGKELFFSVFIEKHQWMAVPGCAAVTYLCEEHQENKGWKSHFDAFGDLQREEQRNQ
jgi:hypothetical protein